MEISRSPREARVLYEEKLVMAFLQRSRRVGISWCGNVLDGAL